MIPRFLTDQAEHFRFRSGKTDIVANAHENGSRRATLLDDQGPSLIFDTPQQLPEVFERAFRAETTIVPCPSSLRNIESLQLGSSNRTV
jgi:hypothetical protein